MSKLAEAVVRANSPLAGALSIAECVNSMTFLWLRQKASTADPANRDIYTKSAAKLWNRKRNRTAEGGGGGGGGQEMTTATAFRRGGDHKPFGGGKYENMGSPREVVAMATVPEGATPIMYACQQARPKELSDIIESKPASVRERDRTLKTALHYCAENPRLDCAELLINSAPDLLDSRDEDGYTPLHLAVISGNIALVRFLLSKGASLDCLDNERHSLVHWATVCGELEALQAVLEAGAEPSSPDMHGGYPVHYAAQMCGPGSEVTSDSRVGMSVLTTLLESKVPVNVTDKDGRQPILWAASAGSSDAILALVNAGANVEAEDKDGLTALHCAASRGHSECLETLITLCGAQVDLMDSNGCSPLFYAVTLGHADATRVLLTHGAQPNRQDRKGRTPAHCGAAKGQVETLRLLSQHEADLWMRNVKGDYPLHEAVASGRKELVLWLLSQRPDAVNAANNDGRCPLHIAAIYDNVQICKILLDAESLVNPVTRSSKGQLMTPLDAALYKGNRGCAKYLQLHGGVPATKLTSEAAALRGVANRPEGEQGPEQVTAEMLKVPENEVKEPRSLGTSPQREQKETTRSLTASPVTITGNRQVTVLDAGSNSHTVQLHVEDELQISRQEDKKEVSGSEDQERKRKRRRKRHQRRDEEDDYVSDDSERRRRRRRRRRDRSEYSSEEDDEEEEESGSRGRRRSSRRDHSDDESEEDSDESDRPRRRRKSRERRSKKSRKDRRSASRRDRSDDEKVKKSGKSRERTKVIKEETKRKEVIKSKKIIEEREDNGRDVTTPTISKSSVTTSEERKEKTTKSFSEIIDGNVEASKSEGDEQETKVQIVEAIVHREEAEGQMEEQELMNEPQEGHVEDDNGNVEQEELDQQATEPEEASLQEGSEKSPESNNSGRKSKLRRMNKEIYSKISEPEISKVVSQVTETKTSSQAKESDAEKEINQNEEVSEATETPDDMKMETAPEMEAIKESETESKVEETEVEQLTEEAEKQLEESEEVNVEPDDQKMDAEPESKEEAEEEKPIIETNLQEPEGEKEETGQDKEETVEKDHEEDQPEEQETSQSQPVAAIPEPVIVSEPHVVSPELEPETMVEKINTEMEDQKDESNLMKVESTRSRRNSSVPDKEVIETKKKQKIEEESDQSESEHEFRQSFETVVDRNEIKRRLMKEKKKGKTKKGVNVTLTNIVDEVTAKFDHEQEISEDERTISGDDGSLDVDTGKALVRIIGRAHEERGRRRRRRHSGERAPPRARSSFSIVSDTQSQHLDSGFEPSPRMDKSVYECRRDRSAGPELTPATVTQAVQHSIRRYHLERRIFHELLELKRLQIRAGRSNEAVLVKRLSEEYRKAALEVGLVPYQGPFQFRTFENYLYDQLRRLQLAERKMVPRLKSNDDLEKLTSALSKTRAGKAFLESVPDNPMFCTHSTHRCYHATHAYTGIPCAAYITKTNHHTIPKPPRSGFLPRIESEKRVKEGQGAEIARCLRYVDPSRPVTLELSHGKDRQVISLPTENLDKNKRYYVTFTIKGGDSASETTATDDRKHRHAKSF